MGCLHGVHPVTPANWILMLCDRSAKVLYQQGPKNPHRVLICDFERRVQCLNRYLDLVPCLYYSSKAAKSTKVVGPFDDTDHAWNWQDQYEHSEATVPQSDRELLEALKLIEKSYPANKIADRPKNSAKLTDSSKRKMVSFDERIPKKHHRGKHCSLCKKHGGTHITHNTQDCRKYESNGTMKKNSVGRKPMDPLAELRDLIKEEVAMYNNPLKSINSRSPTRQWNALSTKRSIRITTAAAIAMIPVHPEVMDWVLLGIYIAEMTVINW